MSVTNDEVSSGPSSIGPPTTNTNNTTSNLDHSVGSIIQNHHGSLLSNSSHHNNSVGDDVVKSDYLRKLKGKKKYFVLRKETEAGPARLEYYANDRKFRMGQPPKKSIVLKACFNINRTDSKYKYAIALHTHNDCLRITMNSEEEMNEWLRLLNSMTADEEESASDVLNSPTIPTKPHFEHVWLVTALNKGLGSQENILGSYRLCLTSKELTLLKVGEHHDEKNSMLKFPLNVIRNVSHDATFGCFFHIEFGRLACTGAGKLSLKTEDNNIGQNMHLLILKAMQNYSKEDVIPRDRTYTWTSYNESGSSHPRSASFASSITPPGMDSIVRTDSVSLSASERRVSGMSPPVAIHTPTPSIAYSTAMCSTDSASSSYSRDYENNNNSGGSGHGYSKSAEDEAYVPWNPNECSDMQPPGVHSLILPLHPMDHSEYVETSIGTVNTPSSCMEIQSPQSPYDAYMPMSPAGTMMMSGNGSVKSGGKLPVSHSRNSSLIEDHEGYVPMIPGGHHSHSSAGSTMGLDEAYLDMDFARQLNISTDDMRRMSPASSESVQSGTPSSEYPLEKVSSYLQTDDFEDGSIAMRPTRAYSVGSRDPSSTFKNRVGKNRLEAVQETFRTRAMSVGSKQPPRKIINQASSSASGLPSTSNGSLSSSWSGSTGRWLPKLPIPNGQPSPGQNNVYPQIHHQEQQSGDSDLMELDFSHNKQKSRKRSLPGPGGNPGGNQAGYTVGNLSSSSSTGSGTALKISPCPRALISSGNETPPSIETPSENPPDQPKSTFSANVSGSGNASPRYATSAPIVIQKNNNNNKSHECGGYLESGNSILTRMTGLDLKTLKEFDDGAYFDMDLTNKIGGLTTSSSNSLKNDKLKSNLVTESISKKLYLNDDSGGQRTLTSNSPMKSTSINSINNSSSRPVVVKANENIASVKCNFTNSHSNSNSGSNETSGLSRSLSSSSNISSTSNSSNTSCISVKSQQQAPLSPTDVPRSVPLTLNLCSSSSLSSSTSSSSTFPNSSGTTGTVPTAATTTATATVVTPTCSSTLLSRIEESPEKQGSQPIYIPLQTSQSSGFTKPNKKASSKEDDHVTYSSVQPLCPIRRNLSYPSELSAKNVTSLSSTTTSTLPQPTSCGKQSQSSTITCTSNFSPPVTPGSANSIIGGLTYAQVEFVKNNADAIKRN